MDFSQLVTKERPEQTIASLRAHGIETEFVKTSEQTKALVLIHQVLDDFCYE